MSPEIPPPRRDWAYFFDIDGTLVELGRTPTGARVHPVLRRHIGALHRVTGGALALVSGRAIADVDRLFPARRMPVAGQHGVELRLGSGRIIRHEFASAPLEWLRGELAVACARFPDLWFEDKGLSLAVHYRRAPQLGGFVHRLVRSLHARMESGYVVQTGKRVVEVLPAGRDKGMALLDFMNDEPFRGRTPVFVGDDVTDERAFAVVNRLDGYSVKVGAGHTLARWRLPNVAAVRAWLASARAAPSRHSTPTT